jgi:IS30 family transposase
MVKKKKISRFRELYNVIESLLDSYTFEDVTKLLKDDYDLSLSTGTLKNYVYQHRQYLSSLAVESEQNKSQDHSSIETNKSLVYESNDTSSEVEVEEKPKPPQRKMSADEALAQFKERQANKSLFDKK